MKLLYIHSQPIPSRSANSIQVMRSCAAFSVIGHDTTLIAPTASPQSDIEVLKWYGVEGFALDRVRVSSRSVPAKRVLRTFRIVRRARVWKPDLVYGRDVISLAILSRISNVPMILEVHAPFDASVRLSHVWAFRYLIGSSRLLGVVTNTSHLRSRIKEEAPHLTVISAPNASPEPERSTKALPATDRIRVGYVGHLYPGRGIETIVELARRCGWAEFHVVGGTEEDVATWRPVTDSVENLVLHGFVPPYRTDSYLAACDILIAPYQDDVAIGSGIDGDWAKWMSPVKLSQYMAHGKPIVCSDHAVLRDLVKDGDNALLVPPADVDRWHDALERLRNAELRQSLGKMAYKRFQERHRSDLRAGQILESLWPTL